MCNVDLRLDVSRVINRSYPPDDIKNRNFETHLGGITQTRGSKARLCGFTMWHGHFDAQQLHAASWRPSLSRHHDLSQTFVGRRIGYSYVESVDGVETALQSGETRYRRLGKLSMPYELFFAVSIFLTDCTFPDCSLSPQLRHRNCRHRCSYTTLPEAQSPTCRPPSRRVMHICGCT